MSYVTHESGGRISYFGYLGKIRKVGAGIYTSSDRQTNLAPDCPAELACKTAEKGAALEGDFVNSKFSSKCCSIYWSHNVCFFRFLPTCVAVLWILGSFYRRKHRMGLCHCSQLECAFRKCHWYSHSSSDSPIRRILVPCWRRRTIERVLSTSNPILSLTSCK